MMRIGNIFRKLFKTVSQSNKLLKTVGLLAYALIWLNYDGKTDKKFRIFDKNLNQM